MIDDQYKTKQNRRNQGQETITKEEVIGIFFLLRPWGTKFRFRLRFFLFMSHLNMQASIAHILDLVTCYLNQNNMAASAGVVVLNSSFWMTETLVIVVVDLLLPLAALGNFKILIWGGYYIYILESKKVSWRVKVLLSWNMHNHDLWSKCACVQIYSEWGYKNWLKIYCQKILSDYWDLMIILADYWWWI